MSFEGGFGARSMWEREWSEEGDNENDIYTTSEKFVNS